MSSQQAPTPDKPFYISILSVDGRKVAEGRIPNTQPFLFSSDEGADVGLDGETNVSPD